MRGIPVLFLNLLNKGYRFRFRLGRDNVTNKSGLLDDDLFAAGFSDRFVSL
ncbi:hypothetical protein D3C71_2132250 [compost metagenome]